MVCTLAAIVCVSSIAQAAQYTQTARLVNERLSYMKDVAGYKVEQHLPIEDLTQEKKVLDQSLSEAESFGLNSETVKPFIVTQMNVAKAIQYRYRADWLSSPESNWKPQDLAEVRLKISTLNTELLKILPMNSRKITTKHLMAVAIYGLFSILNLKKLTKSFMCGIK